MRPKLRSKTINIILGKNNFDNVFLTFLILEIFALILILNVKDIKSN